MNKNTTIILALFAGLIAITIWYSPHDEVALQKPASENKIAKPKHRHEPKTLHRKPVADPGIPSHLSTGIDQFVEHSPSETPSETWQEERDTIVWQISEQAEIILKEEGNISSDVNNEVYVELDIDELKTIEIGEYMDLYIPQINGSYSGEVDYITEHDNGDRTIEAHIPGAGNLYSAVITLGENAVYGTLGTQDDVYIMEGNGQFAWIAAKSDLVAKHSKTHVDAIIPNGTEHKTTESEGLSINLEDASNP